MMDNMDLEKGGVKMDAGKVRLDLVPPEVMMALGTVLTYGAEKYEPWNYTKGMRAGRLVASLKRHMIAMEAGEQLDPETSLPHMWMMLANISMLVSCDLRGVLEWDLPDGESALDVAYDAINIHRARMDYENGLRTESE